MKTLFIVILLVGCAGVCVERRVRWERHCRISYCQYYEQKQIEIQDERDEQVQQERLNKHLDL